jgi:predicted RNA-binding Zn-ribbon protein involved in translation (DUF1610 family)
MMANNNRGCLAAILNLFQRNGGRATATTVPIDFEGSLPYKLRDDFLSPAEASFFRLLKNAVKDDYLVFPKVALKDIIFVSRPNENIAYYNKIDRKHVDFLLCDSANLKPVLAIELDDASHQRQDRVERDALVDKVFEQAGLPLRHAQARFAYSQQELDDLIRGTTAGADNAQPGEIEASSLTDTAPFCPKCGERMVLRTAQRGAKAGEKFYGCPNYPRCREIIPVKTAGS